MWAVFLKRKADWMKLEHYPAIPLITHDPYFSIWTVNDVTTDGDTVHWSGLPQTIRGKLIIDNVPYRFLGKGDETPMQQVGMEVQATTTCLRYTAKGVQLEIQFVSPLLPGDPERLSTPISLIHVEIISMDGRVHECRWVLSIAHDVCSQKRSAFEITGDSFPISSDLYMAWMGRRQQMPLCHSGDLTTIDWGYAIVAGPNATYENSGINACISLHEQGTIGTDTPLIADAMLGYDDIASIQYMGTMCKAWYARNGKTITLALQETYSQIEKIYKRCKAFDNQMRNEALYLGGEAYASITSIAYRQVMAAHKLIADDQGEMIFLSKENDSNGCIATVDISYPSIPIFLVYDPSLIKAFLRPILRYAQSPNWPFHFAPHDIGRYPYATGQVYGLGRVMANVTRGTHHGNRAEEQETYPPFYLYPGNSTIFNLDFQMPIEECGNMLIMIAAYIKAADDCDFAKEYSTLLRQWKNYLVKYGKDPGCQLTTDDFAGHSDRNMNLAAKAIFGVRCYAYIAERCGWGDVEEALQETQKMASFWKAHIPSSGGTALTFQGDGWSMKYNTIWDILFDFGIFSKDFYENEIDCYLSHANAYGCPLDSRADYTKSDWLMWCSIMTDDREKFLKMITPLLRYLQETPSRVPFSDWYDTVTGQYMRFIARSVQGGVFMPMLKERWR